MEAKKIKKKNPLWVWIKRFLIVAIGITLLLYFVWANTTQTEENGVTYINKITKTNKVTLNEFITAAQNGEFAEIKLSKETMLQWYRATSGENTMPSITLQKDIKTRFYTVDKTEKSAMTSLTELGIPLTGDTKIIVSSQAEWMFTRMFVEQIIPTIFMLLMLLVLFRMMMPKGWMWWSPFNIQVWKLKNKTEVKTKFSDVAGMEECKEELIEIVDFLKNPDKYAKAGARVPKWVLLYGPPWSGKTLLARAVAWEANVPFFTASGSEFMEMLVWMGAAKVRELFTKAKNAAPAIVFIDEIDAIGKKRWVWMTGGHQEQEQTLNQILTEMDWFDTNTKVIVIAATNRPDTLDPALLRSGRFDRKILIGKPTLEERVLIARYHLSNKKVDSSVNLDSFARRTSGFVGADIENILNEAALKAAKEWRDTIVNNDIEYGLEKLVMWPEKKIKSLQEKEKKIVAYHELWHAITAFATPDADPVEKISIVSRGMALGVTRMMPAEDSYLYSKSKFIGEMVSLLWGRAAEEIFFGEDNITTGWSNDFERISRIARDMIVKYGMDEELWQIAYESDRDDWGRVSYKPYSEKTAQLIDEKVKWLIDNAYLQAKSILLAHRPLMEKIAVLLLEKEYLTREEFEEIMNASNEKVDEIIQRLRDEYKEELEKINVGKNDKKKEKTQKNNIQKNKKEKETPDILTAPIKNGNAMINPNKPKEQK